MVKNALEAQYCSQLFLVVRPWYSLGHATLYPICAEVAADRLARRPNMINMYRIVAAYQFDKARRMRVVIRAAGDSSSIGTLTDSWQKLVVRFDHLALLESTVVAGIAEMTIVTDLSAVGTPRCYHGCLTALTCMKMRDSCRSVRVVPDDELRDSLQTSPSCRPCGLHTHHHISSRRRCLALYCIIQACHDIKARVILISACDRTEESVPRTC